MKNQVLVLIMLIHVPVFSQDIIILKDKGEISARIVQEDKEYVQYMQEGSTGKILKQLSADQVKKVKYEKVNKTANLIEIVHDSLENEYFLNDVISHLIESGYIIEEFDNKYFTVSTQYVNNDRLTVEIKDNKAAFRCFQMGREDEVYPNVTATLAYGQKPKPGEHTGTPGTTAFKKLDIFCRSYLKDGKSTMEYKTRSVE
jgi:hypothetical protein